MIHVSKEYMQKLIVSFILFDISTLKFQAWKHLLDTLSKHPELQ